MQKKLLSDLFGQSQFKNKEIEILGFVGDEQTQNRLHEIGLWQGTSLIVISQSPFNGPIMIQAGGALFCLRQEEAKCIQIELK